MANLVDRWGPAGYEPSGGPQRPNPLGMLPAWLVELILGTGTAPPAPPPPPPRRGIPGVDGTMRPPMPQRPGGMLANPGFIRG